MLEQNSVSHLHLPVPSPPVLVSVPFVLGLGRPVIVLGSDLQLGAGRCDEHGQFGPHRAVHHELTGLLLGGRVWGVPIVDQELGNLLLWVLLFC